MISPSSFLCTAVLNTQNPASRINHQVAHLSSTAVINNRIVNTSIIIFLDRSRSLTGEYPFAGRVFRTGLYAIRRVCTLCAPIQRRKIAYNALLNVSFLIVNISREIFDERAFDKYPDKICWKLLKRITFEIVSFSFSTTLTKVLTFLSNTFEYILHSPCVPLWINVFESWAFVGTF